MNPNNTDPNQPPTTQPDLSSVLSSQTPPISNTPDFNSNGVIPPMPSPPVASPQFQDQPPAPVPPTPAVPPYEETNPTPLPKPDQGFTPADTSLNIQSPSQPIQPPPLFGDQSPPSNLDSGLPSTPNLSSPQPSITTDNTQSNFFNPPSQPQFDQNPPSGISTPSDTTTTQPSSPSLNTDWNTSLTALPQETQPTPQPTLPQNPSWSPSSPLPTDQTPPSSPLQPLQQSEITSTPSSVIPNPMEETKNAQPAEQPPTDLSHLITPDSSNGTTDPSSLYNPSPSQPETLVSPPTANLATPVVPTFSDGGHKGIPKWVIGIMAGLLLTVAGASAYFILGIGQNNQQTTSIPAVQTPRQTTTTPPAPSPAAQAPVATGSGNFGDLNDSANQQATSAADLLRQRQQGR